MEKPIPKNELVARFMSGDESAISEIVLTFTKPVAHWIRGNFPHIQSNDVDDIIQETFTALIAHRDNLRIHCSLFPYLVQIAKNKSRDFCRRQSPCNAIPVDGIVNPNFEDGPSSESHDSYRLKLRTLVGKLNPRDRELLRAGIDGQNGDDWAVRLAFEWSEKPGTLRVQRHRLIKRLRQKYEELKHD